MAYNTWSDQQKNYQIFLAIPEEMRPDGIATIEAFSRKAGVPQDTLALWETLPGFWDAVYERGRAIIGRSLADIMVTMRDKAVDGSVQAAKLCMALMGVATEKLDIKHSMDQDQLMLIVDPDAAREYAEAHPPEPEEGQE